MILMSNKYSPGDTAYIIESNMFIREVKIVSLSGGFAVISFTKGEGRIQLRVSRLYPTKEDAAANLPKRERPRPDWF